MRATVDVLGEEVQQPREAEAIARSYHAALEAIEADGLDANVSIKLTGFGLKVDPELCRSLVHELVRDADARGIFVRIDMEDASTTDDTLALYRDLREEGRDGVGVVLQATLRRTLEDIEALAPLRPSVRLCKGIYLEAPSIAFQEFEAIRKSFVACLDALLAPGAGPRSRRTTSGSSSARSSGSQSSTGTRTSCRCCSACDPTAARELVAAGHPLRVYVPYGQQWYEYSLRRLQENPKVAGYVARDVAGRLVSRAGRRGASTASPLG